MRPVKLAKLAGVLGVLYVILPMLLLSKNYYIPENWSGEETQQFMSSALVYGLAPHVPAYLVLCILLAAKGIFTLTDLRQYKPYFFAAIFTLVVHLGMAVLFGGRPVEFGMLVYFFIVPAMDAASIVLGLILGRII